MANNNKHIERAKYMLANKLNVAEAAVLLKLDASTIRKSLKLAGDPWKQRVESMIAWKNVNFNTVSVDPTVGKTNAKETIHEQRLKYILAHKTIKSYSDFARKFKLTGAQITYSVKKVKKSNPILSDKVIQALQERNATRQKIVNFIFTNQNVSTERITKKFKVTPSVISKALVELRNNSVDNYQDAKQILNKNKNTLYRQYADYIIQNKASYKETANKFGTKADKVSGSINNLKIYDPQLYAEVKSNLKTK